LESESDFGPGVGVQVFRDGVGVWSPKLSNPVFGVPQQK